MFSSFFFELIFKMDTLVFPMCCSTEKLLKIFSVVFFSCKVLPDAVFSLHGVFGGVAGGGALICWDFTPS